MESGGIIAVRIRDDIAIHCDIAVRDERRGIGLAEQPLPSTHVVIVRRIAEEVSTVVIVIVL